MYRNFFKGNPAFKKRGFYLHACWQFNYPFAVRSWHIDDYQAMFNFMKCLELDRVMLWPMVEAVPPPLSEDDAAWFQNIRDIINAANNTDLDCWVLVCPALSSDQEIRSVPVSERHLYPHQKTYRHDNQQEYSTFLQHLTKVIKIMNNADGYVVIDGDPGSYPHAEPRDFTKFLHDLQKIVKDNGIKKDRQKLIPWLWCGWGCDWKEEGTWQPDIKSLTRPVIELLKKEPLEEPWEFLPGRSIKEGWANGRTNFELMEERNIVERSTLMLYEIVEFEPTQPAVILQFDDIRRVVREELKHAGTARGVFGNAQQPIMSIPNLFLFSGSTYNPDMLNLSDYEILNELAHFLGGDPDLLVPAWSILNQNLKDHPKDFVTKLKNMELTGSPASYIPGGPQKYLNIVASFADTCKTVFQQTSTIPKTKHENYKIITKVLESLKKWWEIHQYVQSGKGFYGFSFAYTHPRLFKPLLNWMKKYSVNIDDEFKKILSSSPYISSVEAEKLIDELKTFMKI